MNRKPLSPAKPRRRGRPPASEGRPPPAQALLHAASTLMYQQGVRGCTVDELASKAGVSKPSLYASFGGKTSLAIAYLDDRDSAFTAWFEQQLSQAPNAPLDRAIFCIDVIERFARAKPFCGCAFLNAAAEARAMDAKTRKSLTAITRRQKDRLREVLRQCLAQGGHHDPERASQDIALVIDGALAGTMYRPAEECFAVARRIARSIVDRAPSPRTSLALPHETTPRTAMHD